MIQKPFIMLHTPVITPEILMVDILVTTATLWHLTIDANGHLFAIFDERNRSNLRYYVK